MATAIVTDTMRQHADVLLARADRWARGRRNRDGLEFVLFASSRTLADGTPIYNMTRSDARGCTCKSWLYRSACSHALAVQTFNERKVQIERQAVQPSKWHYCERKCGELLPPEHTRRYCDHCWAGMRRLLDGMGG